MNKAISLKNVSLSYPEPSGSKIIPILKEIYLEVQQGETVSIVGASGSGKTSLLMLIAGVEKATKGNLKIINTDITDMSEDDLAIFRRRNIGVVFQNFHLIPTMTAKENVSVALEFAGDEDTGSKASEWLEKVELSHRLNHYPDQLSGGEQQRVALARAFATRPRLLLADEPTGNLDSNNGKLVTELLLNLQKEHATTLLLITHDKELASMTERQLILQKGTLIE